MFLYSMNVSADTFLCIPDKVTGFKFNNLQGEWVEASFASRKKYLVKKGTKQKGYIFHEFGNENVKSDCGRMRGTDNFLKCDGLVGEVYFLGKTLRYTRAWMQGYLHNITGLTPTLEIGSCSKL